MGLRPGRPVDNWLREGDNSAWVAWGKGTSWLAFPVSTLPFAHTALRQSCPLLWPIIYRAPLVECLVVNALLASALKWAGH